MPIKVATYPFHELPTVFSQNIRPLSGTFALSHRMSSPLVHLEGSHSDLIQKFRQCEPPS